MIAADIQEIWIRQKNILQKAFPNGNAALDISVGADRKTIAEMIQSQCKEIGLTINIVELDSAGISTTTTNGEHQSCLYGMGFNIFGDDARRIFTAGFRSEQSPLRQPGGYGIIR